MSPQLCTKGHLVYRSDIPNCCLDIEGCVIIHICFNLKLSYSFFLPFSICSFSTRQLDRYVANPSVHRVLALDHVCPPNEDAEGHS